MYYNLMEKNFKGLVPKNSSPYKSETKTKQQIE